MLSTLEPESAYSAFNLNLVSELAPLQNGDHEILTTCEVFARAGGKIVLCTRDRHMFIVGKGLEGRVGNAGGFLRVTKPSGLEYAFPNRRRHGEMRSAR